MPATAYIVDTLIGSITSIGAVGEFINPHCTEQWGLTLANQYSSVFPVAFKIAAKMTTTVQSANSNNVYSTHCLADVSTYTITAFRDGVKSADVYVYWLAIGY